VIRDPDGAFTVLDEGVRAHLGQSLDEGRRRPHPQAHGRPAVHGEPQAVAALQQRADPAGHDGAYGERLEACAVEAYDVLGRREPEEAVVRLREPVDVPIGQAVGLPHADRPWALVRPPVGGGREERRNRNQRHD
jgi:hypothetical protein